MQFSVPMAVATGRPRFGNGHAYTPTRTAHVEKKIRDAYRGACVRKYGNLVTAPERARVMVAATFEMPAPKGKPRWVPSWLWRTGFIPFVTKPDVDNFLKVILDGLNPYKERDGTIVPVAWCDDSQVVEVHAYKLDRKRGGAEMTRVTVFWED